MIADHPVLSLAELEQHDPRPTGHGAERRFLCPFPACADHQRREHKNLAANIESGLWECKRCGASGKLTEKWERPQPRTRALRVGPYEKARRAMGLVSAPVGGSHQSRAGAGTQCSSVARPPADAATDQGNHVAADTRETVPTWRRRWDQAVPVAGTPAEAYLASRSIPIDTATAAGVRYLDRWGHWTRDALDDEWHLEGTSRRVVFPIVDKVGELIGIQGRKIADTELGEKMLTNGHGGLFVAGATWPLGEVECVAIVEAPIDALSLAAAGIPALATQGTSCPDWVPLALAFKSVLLGHDNDEPDGNGLRAGDLAAAGLVPALRSYGAEPERWRPRAKDWNQDLQNLGLDRLRRIVAGQSVSEPEPTAVESPVEQCDSPSELTPVVPELPSDPAVEAYPGAVPVEQPERAEVDELLRWLSAADLPHEPFKLRPWVRVADVARFVETLQTELSSHVVGPRWRGAAEDLRELARLYGGVPGEERQSRAPPGSHLPVSMSKARTGTEELVARRVQGDGARAG